MSLSLTTQEQQLLKSCEQVIEAGIEAFVAVGRALMTIQDLKLYRASHPTFEEYCRARWDYSRQHAYRLIAATSVVDQVSAAGVLPNERQARELLKVAKETRYEVWQAAISSAGGGRVTTRHVEGIIRKLAPVGKRRIFGDPLNFRGLRHAPINEQGVVFLFGIVSKELGFVVESVHNPFPDCVAKRLVDTRRRRWQEVRIEFEYQSRNFLAHHHRETECDLIVCWEHNWLGAQLAGLSD
jgi:hypothetical protein